MQIERVVTDGRLRRLSSTIDKNKVTKKTLKKKKKPQKPPSLIVIHRGTTGQRRPEDFSQSNSAESNLQSQTHTHTHNNNRR